MKLTQTEKDKLINYFGSAGKLTIALWNRGKGSLDYCQELAEEVFKK